MRMMRGKRMAKPLLWRSERIRLLKATSSTMFGSTVRQPPKSSMRVLVEVFGEPCDLGIGQPGVGLAYVFERVAIAHGEGVVAESSGALSVAVLCGGDDDIERGQLALQLEPCETATARLIDAGRGLQHDAFIAAGTRVDIGLLQLLGACEAHHGSEDETCEGVLAGLRSGIGLAEERSLILRFGCGRCAADDCVRRVRCTDLFQRSTANGERLV